MPVVFGAMLPEEIIGRLLTGPGITSTQLTSAAYLAMAEQLNAAAAGTDGSMTQMGGTWQGLSSEQAQAAFRNHAAWLRDQALVAAQTAAVAEEVSIIFTAAQSAMAGVAVWLAEFRAKEAALTAMTAVGAPTGPALLLAEAEYVAIWVAAIGVMVGYAGALVPTLATLPPPVTAPPIVTGGGGLGGPTTSTLGDPTSGGPIGGTRTTPTHSLTSTQSSSQGGTDKGSGGTDKTPTDPTQPTDPTNSTSPTDAQQLADPGVTGVDSGTSGFGDGASDQQGLYGTSQNSPTLAGLNGGVGSLVALNMARGGLGSMPGVSTGFRMPANWNPGAGRAFGALPQQTAPGQMARKTPPRGAVAPKARMRRRRDDEKKPSKVFVPGEPQEVPVLEKAPVIGVIEYADGNGRDGPVLEPALAVGVIERVEDELVPASAERPR